MLPDPFSPPTRLRDGTSLDLPEVLAHERCLFNRLRKLGGRLTGPHCYSLLKLVTDHQRQLDYWLGQLFLRADALGLTVLDAAIRGGDAGPVDSGNVEGTLIRDLLAEVRAEHEQLSQRLRVVRGKLGDAPTGQVLQRLADFHDTAAWMLRIVVEGPNRVWDKEICFRDAPDDSGRV